MKPGNAHPSLKILTIGDLFPGMPAIAWKIFCGSCLYEQSTTPPECS